MARAPKDGVAVSRVALVATSLLAAACASTPHPPTGMMWGYIAKSTDPPTLEIVGYAPDRPSCEFSRAMGQTRSGVMVPSQRSDQCQPLEVLPYREGTDSVYWVFGPDINVDRFGLGANDRNVCLSLREEAIKLRPLRADALSECERLSVKRAM